MCLWWESYKEAPRVSLHTYSTSCFKNTPSAILMFATMAVHHLFAFFILLLISNTGFCAEISVFVQTGDSVQLDIQTQQLSEFDDLYWRNEKKENVVKYFHKTKDVKLHSSYKDRVDFNNKTFSLTLKNMQKTESGLYTAGTSGESENNIVTYRVSVIDAVEAPVLTVNSSGSSDSCTVNFTLWNPSSVTIATLSAGKKDRINITQLCEENERRQMTTIPYVSSYKIGLIIVCVVVGVIVFAGLVLYCFCKNKKGVKPADDTDYDDVETQKMTGDTWTTVTYCTVGGHQTPSSAHDC